MQPLTCIVCDYQPDTAYNGCENNQPYKATAFTTHGHYGSTFFDSMGSSSIEINVCDDCLRKAVAKKQVLYYTHLRPKPELYDESKHG